MVQTVCVDKDGEQISETRNIAKDDNLLKEQLGLYLKDCNKQMVEVLKTRKEIVEVPVALSSEDA